MSGAGYAFNALFGVDGTELPDPLPVLPDPLTGPARSPWPGPPAIPAVPLPPIPDGRAMHAAIVAVLGEPAPGPAPPRAPARPGYVPRRPLVPVPSGTGDVPRAGPVLQALGSWLR